MYSQDELKSLHGFLRSTAEGNLKKMLLGGRMTELHLRVFLRVLRSCSEADFITHIEANTFPKIKFSSEEKAIGDKCYEICLEACAKVGLVSAAKKAA
ncbi:MAG: hypothetical protein AAB250_18705 [Bdellovibrionota bacterium]